MGNRRKDGAWLLAVGDDWNVAQPLDERVAEVA